MIRFLAFALASLLGLVLAPAAAMADEGMWTFDHFPAAKVKAAYGVTIDQAWLDHVQGAAVRLAGGCSASIVTNEGLILTNNHCIAECAQNLSTEGKDLFKSGYSVARREEEKTCPGFQAEVLVHITDVTPKVLGAGAGLSGEALVKARTAASANIEKDGCGADKTLRCQVVKFYQGGQYKLYTYRKYTDVRLVFSPGVPAAFFGGDPDNFNFPRYDLDCAFIRLYENGKPVSTPGHLVWDANPPRDGEPVFVAGNPGGTDRQLTVSQLETQRDLTLPLTLVQMAELRGRAIRFGEESPEHKRMAGDLLFGLENSYKVYFGRQFALNDKAFLDIKRAQEADLKAKVGPQANDPWAAIAAVQVSQRELYLPYRLVEGGPSGSKLYGYAKALVRAAQEREKPSADRLAGYSDTQLPLLEHNLLSAEPVERPLEQVTLEFWLTKVRELLTTDDPNTRLILGKDSPEDLSATFAQTSTLADSAVRKALWEGGLKAVEACDDPLIKFVLRTDPAARMLPKAWDERVTGPLVQPTEQIARLRFQAYGEAIYPDATFTLRLSYGKIAGWTERGNPVPSFTYFGGLYERATGKDPFKLDARWVAARDKLNPRTVFDIATTNDIIGGNSGSPLINARAEVIGAVFDGNIHSLGGDYAYDGTLNRSVAVSTAAITEALDKVYGQTALVKELTAK